MILKNCLFFLSTIPFVKESYSMRIDKRCPWFFSKNPLNVHYGSAIWSKDTHICFKLYFNHIIKMFAKCFNFIFFASEKNPTCLVWSSINIRKTFFLNKVVSLEGLKHIYELDKMGFRDNKILAQMYPVTFW